MFILILSLIALVSVFSFLSLAPFVPTRTSDLDRIARIIDLKKWERFLEIGAGTAKVSLFLAKKYPDATIVWVEFSPLFYLISYLRVLFSWQKNICILFGDALKMDISAYDVLYVFWLPETITTKLAPKLMENMGTNARMYSYSFKMSDDRFVEKRYKESPELLSVYEYRKG